MINDCLFYIQTFTDSKDIHVNNASFFLISFSLEIQEEDFQESLGVLFVFSAESAPWLNLLNLSVWTSSSEPENTI